MLFKKENMNVHDLLGSISDFQIVLVNVDSRNENLVFSNNPIPLSHGKFEVTEIVDWDEDKNIV
jgi:hypothetical protein